MISGIGGLALYMVAFYGLTVVAVMILVSLLASPLLSWFSHYTAPARRRMLWCLSAAPHFAGLLAVIITLFPSMSHELGWSLDHCHYHGDLHGHLCWYHPADFELNSFLGVWVLALTLMAAYHAMTSLFVLVRHWRESRALLNFAESAPGGEYRIDSDFPSAFTLGILSPKRIVSHGLVRALSSEELNVVQVHEQAHVRRYDPLQIWLFKSLTRYFPKRIGTELQRAFVLAIEQDADESVTTQISDRALIASTMVKVNRLSSRFVDGSHRMVSCHFGLDTLEQRISYLLTNDTGRPFPLTKLVLCLLMLFATGAYYADALHHFIEALISH